MEITMELPHRIIIRDYYKTINSKTMYHVGIEKVLSKAQLIMTANFR